MTTNYVNSAMFEYQREDKLFVTEISTLGKSFDFARIFNDACDEGLVLLSARTGSETKWYVEKTACNNENEIQYWKLFPTYESCRKVRNVSGCSMIIFNN